MMRISNDFKGVVQKREVSPQNLIKMFQSNNVSIFYLLVDSTGKINPRKSVTTIAYNAGPEYTTQITKIKNEE